MRFFVFRCTSKPVRCSLLADFSMSGSFRSDGNLEVAHVLVREHRCGWLGQQNIVGKVGKVVG